MIKGLWILALVLTKALGNYAILGNSFFMSQNKSLSDCADLLGGAWCDGPEEDSSPTDVSEHPVSMDMASMVIGASSSCISMGSSAAIKSI